MPSEIASQNEELTLHCPSCGEEKFGIVPMAGKNQKRNFTKRDDMERVTLSWEMLYRAIRPNTFRMKTRTSQ